MGSRARDIRTGGAECLGENQTILDAARMADLDVGGLQICGEDNRRR